MKLSKAFILTIVLCMAAVVSNAFADPVIVISEDKVRAGVEINVEGVVGPAKWEETYTGPAYLGTLFQGADIEIVANTSYDTYAGDSRFVNSAPGDYQGEVSVGAMPPGVGPGVNWEGKTYLRIDWVFKVEDGNTTVDLLAEDQASDGKTAVKLIDVTMGTVVASLEPENTGQTETVTLMDSHIYRLKAYSWARDFGNGDPAGVFNITFGTPNVVVAAP